jgi:hypothetical protein
MHWADGICYGRLPDCLKKWLPGAYFGGKTP